MLISHTHKFIFIKSTKTAGTSTEVYFEQFCRPPVDLPEDWALWHSNPENQVTDFGVVAARGAGIDTSDFFNHMTPSQLVAIVGHELWEQYFTFINVRNPWDKAVSRFFHSPDWDDIKDDAPSQSAVKDAFNSFVINRKMPQIEQSVLSQDLPFDDFIRYENLENDIARIMDSLKLTCDREIPRLKTHTRSSEWGDYRALYGADAKQHVAETYSDWIERFRYTF